LTKSEVPKISLEIKPLKERNDIGLVKICSLNDYLEMLLPLVMARPQLEFQVTCLILQFADLFDYDSVTMMILEYHFDSVVFSVIDLMVDQNMR
jgi:hypothetical protein